MIKKNNGSEPSLLPATGSPGEDVADATFGNVPVAGAVTVTVCDTFAPLARLASTSQVTTPPASVPPSHAETNTTPGGKVSVPATALAVEGPWFVTVTV